MRNGPFKEAKGEKVVTKFNIIFLIKNNQI